jgi:FtsH-binding integral membrane protein
LQNTQKTTPNLPELIQFGLLAVAILGYSLPWLASKGVSLQPGALDLAEWLTLHPAVRAGTPLLLPALLLRLSLVCTGWLFLLNLQRSPVRWQRWLQSVFAIGVWFALFPPLAFLSGEFGDRNYQQQAALWGIYTLVSVAITLRGGIAQRYWLLIGLALAAMTCALIGIIWGYTLVARYEIPLRLGAGGIIYMAALGGFVFVILKTR